MNLRLVETVIPFRDSSSRGGADEHAEIDIEVRMLDGEKVVLMDMNPTSACGDKTITFKAGDILALNELIAAFKGKE